MPAETGFMIDTTATPAGFGEAAGKPDAKECEDAKRWLKRIKEARQYDEHARKDYAIARDYCRGTAGQGTFDVCVNIAGTFTELKTALLFASDPKPQVTPADSCGPSRLKDARELSKSLEIVIAHLWKKSRLKRAGKQQARSMCTTGVGWIKSTWREQTGKDPIIAQRIADQQDNLARLALERSQADDQGDPYPRDYDAEQAEIEKLILGLQGKVEAVQARGIVDDFVRAEDIQVAPGVDALTNYLDAPWITHRTFMPCEDAEALADSDTARAALKHATRYYPIKPQDSREAVDAGPLANKTPDDADSHSTGSLRSSADGGSRESVCVWEVWDAATMTVLTLVEGMEGYLRKPYAPEVPTTRFYPFFLYAPIEVDGDRHPKSLVIRTTSLIDEYNRTRSNFRTHRARCMPKTAFDARGLEPGDVTRVENGGICELIGLSPKGNGSLRDAVVEITYPHVDMALYDTSAIRADLELSWGIQEALASSIHTAKTLGEAEIQQTGTQARHDFMRDALDEMLADKALYTAEIALQRLTQEDAFKIAGPEALWPEGVGIEELSLLLNVDVKAGSSGKPDTTAERQAWGILSVQLEKALTEYSQLVQANPLDTAKCIENMVEETLSRFGEHTDSSQFLPQPGHPMPLMNPQTGQMVMAYPAPNQPPPQMPPPGAGGGMPPMGPPQGPPQGPPMGPPGAEPRQMIHSLEGIPHGQ